MSRSISFSQWWTWDNDAWNTQACRSSRVILFFFFTTENGDQQDICNLNTMPCVQRPLYLNEMTNNFSSIQVGVPKGVDGRTRDVLEQCMTTCGKAAGIKAKGRSRARKEDTAKKVRGYYDQFADAKHLEYKSLVDNEVFDLVDLRKVKPRNYVTGRWVLTIMTDKQGNFFQGKGKMGIERFQDKQKEYQQTDSPAFHKTWISDQLPNGNQQEVLHFFTLILRQLSFKHSLIVWIVMLCVNCHQKQVTLLFKLRDWRNLLIAWLLHLDAGGTFWTRHFVLLVWSLRELTDVVMYCTQPKRVSQIGNKKCSTQVNGTDDISLESCVRS